MHAYPQMKDFSSQNVQKYYAVIIDNKCDLIIPSVSFYLQPFLREVQIYVFLKFSKVSEILQALKNVML